MSHNKLRATTPSTLFTLYLSPPFDLPCFLLAHKALPIWPAITRIVARFTSIPSASSSATRGCLAVVWRLPAIVTCVRSCTRQQLPIAPASASTSARAFPSAPGLPCLLRWAIHLQLHWDDRLAKLLLPQIVCIAKRSSDLAQWLSPQPRPQSPVPGPAPAPAPDPTRCKWMPRFMRNKFQSVANKTQIRRCHWGRGTA